MAPPTTAPAAAAPRPQPPPRQPPTPQTPPTQPPPRQPPQRTCTASLLDIDFMVAMLVGKGAAWAEVRVPLVNKPRKTVVSIVFEIRMMSSTLIVPSVPAGA